MWPFLFIYLLILFTVAHLCQFCQYVEFVDFLDLFLSCLFYFTNSTHSACLPNFLILLIFLIVDKFTHVIRILLFFLIFTHDLDFIILAISLILLHFDYYIIFTNLFNFTHMVYFTKVVAHFINIS